MQKIIISCGELNEASLQNMKIIGKIREKDEKGRKFSCEQHYRQIWNQGTENCESVQEGSRDYRRIQKKRTYGGIEYNLEEING